MNSTVRLPRLPARVFAVLAAVVAGTLSIAALAPRAAGASQPQCADSHSATRNAQNPLMVSAGNGGNPLSGANFFVDGPKHGAAAGAIARLLGTDTGTPVGSQLPSFSDTESWSSYENTVNQKLRSEPARIGSQITMLEKVAAQPESQKVSSYSQGGGPGAIYSQTEKLFCHNFTADPGSVPIIMTYFLHPALGGCASPGQMAAAAPDFRRRVDELAAAIGNRPVVLMLEEDAFGSSRCMARRGDLSDWERLIHYEVDKTSHLPHAVVYLEAGYSDANSPAYTAHALNASGISEIRGFYTNDTHMNWTIKEIKWGEKVSAKTHGADFIVNTAQNGNGPARNHANRTTAGNENLCNPGGRALGPQPTTNTGYPHVDAFVWTSVPGNSSGTCNGGTPSGTFWWQRAVQLAAAANDRLGRKFVSRPY